MLKTFLSGGKTIRMNSTEPPGPGPHPAILLLHGAGGNVDFWLDRIAPAIAALGVAVYAVHYFDRTGTKRADLLTLTDGVHVPLWLETVADAMQHLARQPHVAQDRIALLGISLGAFLSLSLGAQMPERIRAIVDISGGLVPPYAAQAGAAFPPTVILHGDADSVVSVSHARDLHATLTRLGVPHQLEILPGEGHWFSAGAQLRILAAVAGFLKTHLLP